MCPPKAPKVQAPAAAPAPAAQGADSIKLGGDSTMDAEDLARQGLIGRAALRIGRARSGVPGTGAGGGAGSPAAAASGVGGAPSLGIGPISQGPASGGLGGSFSNASSGINTGDAGLRIGRTLGGENP